MERRTQVNLIEQLLDPHAYQHSVGEPVQLIETHISWVFLAGSFAYKLKKPIRTPFLDYTTLQRRHSACVEEVRLGHRYSPELYLAVVPITQDNHGVHMDGEGLPVDFAVQMKRFPADALLSRRIESGSTTSADMILAAKSIAQMHLQAEIVSADRQEIVESIGQQALENFRYLDSTDQLEISTKIAALEAWTLQHWHVLRDRFYYRLTHGWMRQCHGDLHCDNFIFWQGKWSAFDGIEFNVQLSNIDVISDIAFMVMDLQSRNKGTLAAVLLSAYLEVTGDYHGLQLLRWYIVYRALVRAKVASIRSSQVESRAERVEQLNRMTDYIALAHNCIDSKPLRLWITHGVSGSGKTVGSQWAIAEHQMIRLRSDIERKRLFSSASAEDRGGAIIATGIYSTTASEATYQHLWSLARELLMAGYSVLVDATFLQQQTRQRFHALAQTFAAEFRILHFQADQATLKHRIAQRLADGSDASDATIRVLEYQLTHQDPLTATELTYVVPPET